MQHRCDSFLAGLDGMDSERTAERALSMLPAWLIAGVLL